MPTLMRQLLRALSLLIISTGCRHSLSSEFPSLVSGVGGKNCTIRVKISVINKSPYASGRTDFTDGNLSPNSSGENKRTIGQPKVNLLMFNPLII